MSFKQELNLDLDETSLLISTTDLDLNESSYFFINGDSTFLNPDKTLIEPQPLLEGSNNQYRQMVSTLKKSKSFITTGRRFRCVCGKRTLCLISDACEVKHNDSSICCQKYEKYNFGKWMRLSNDDRKYIKRSKIENLPFFKTSNGYVFLKCRGDCNKFSNQLEIINKFFKGSQA